MSHCGFSTVARTRWIGCPKLNGKRLAIGPEGSGTRHLVTNLLAHNGITKDTASLLPLSGQPAVSALEKDEIDAIFLDFTPEAPIIQGLFRNPDVRIKSFSPADAYTRRFPYLSKLALPQGGFDLKRNIPPSDVSLLGTAAALVARKDLHPALVFLLSQAAAEVHSSPGLFQQAGDFPKATDPEFPMSDTAVRFYKDGPPFLQRFLPFWVVNLVEQLIVLALPILAVTSPVFKLAPALYRWRARRRILYWYRQLKKVEASLDVEPTAGQAAMLRAEIDRIEDDVNSSSVPLASAAATSTSCASGWRSREPLLLPHHEFATRPDVLR